MGNEAHLRTAIIVVRVIVYSLALIGLQTGILLQIGADTLDPNKVSLGVPLTIGSGLLLLACWQVTRYLSNSLPVVPDRPRTIREWAAHLSAVDPYASDVTPLPVEVMSDEEAERRTVAARRAIPLTFAYLLGVFAVCMAFVTPTSPVVIACAALSFILVAVAFGFILPSSKQDESLVHGLSSWVSRLTSRDRWTKGEGG